MILVLASMLIAAVAVASEGKWTPQQLLELDPAWLKAQGLALDQRQLWDPAKGTGLLAATVSTGSCSGGFISPDGLFVTNHHCLFSNVQEHSTPENDLITNGFLARSRSDELSSKTMRVTIPRRFTDVTKEILKAIPAKADDAARLKAIERKQKELVAACEKQPDTRCKVATMDGGVSYVLTDSVEVKDVRLVWAPPRAIGEYGGEVDNWMWPRHTGDFAIGRLYVAPDGSSREHDKANVPYHSGIYFPISTKGVKPDDFVMIFGYPGTTYRSLTAAEMDERGELWFPRREELYGEWIRIMEETTKASPEGSILVAADLKTLANRYKNAQGQIAGLARGRILEKQREQDRAVIEWARSKPAYRKAVAAYGELEKLMEEQRKTWEHDFLLDQLSVGPKSLYLGQQLARLSVERTKPDLERGADFVERDLPKLRNKLARMQKSYFEPADKAMLASFVKRALALPKESRITAIDQLFPGEQGEASIAKKIDELYSRSKVLDEGEREKMFDENQAGLHARKDPLVELGFAIDKELRTLADRKDRWAGTVSRLRPEWRRAVIAHAGKPVAPDANLSLRVSFGKVMGYSPRDGVFYTPQTTLGGAVAKHTGEEPFDLPDDVLQAARQRRVGPWADPELGEVPVAFLADADTTGGNSGSPMLNARGELVGVNFDRVWENVANDFGFNPQVGRNVSVDVRYMLWMLDQVQGAEELLKEMGVRGE